MPLTENLASGMMVVKPGYAVRLISFASSVEGNDYWNCETLFTDPPEQVMLAFRHHAQIKELHTKCR